MIPGRAADPASRSATHESDITRGQRITNAPPACYHIRAAVIQAATVPAAAASYGAAVKMSRAAPILGAASAAGGFYAPGLV